MMEITESSQLHSILAEEPAVLVYYYNDSCAPCVSLRPKVVAMITDLFPLVKIVFVNASKNIELTAQFGIFSAPTILVVLNGKEVIRESKYVSVEELRSKIYRYYSLLFD
jgi:thioredoxin 1